VPAPVSPSLVVFSSIPVDDERAYAQYTAPYLQLSPPFSSVKIVDVSKEAFQDSAKLQQVFDDTFRDWPQHKREVSIIFGGHGAFTGKEGAWNWIYGNGVAKSGDPIVGVDARTLAGALERSLKNTEITSNVMIDACHAGSGVCAFPINENIRSVFSSSGIASGRGMGNHSSGAVAAGALGRALISSHEVKDVNGDGRITLQELRDYTRQRYRSRFGEYGRLGISGVETYHGDANSVIYLVPKSAPFNQP
jgi:hypothetical protein